MNEPVGPLKHFTSAKIEHSHGENRKDNPVTNIKQCIRPNIFNFDG